MKKKIALISLATFGLLLSGLVGCGKTPAEPSESKPDETSQKSEDTSKPTSEPSSEPSSSAAPSSSEITQPSVTQTVTEDVDGYGATIVWDAQDSNKDAAEGFDSSGKFKAAGDYVQYVFESPMALEARLYVKIANRSGSSDSPYDRATGSGNQSIWYDYYNGPGWKYAVTVNGATVDQDAQGKVTIGEEEVDLNKVTYSDFTTSTSSSTLIVAPWFTFNVIEGKNVIRIERSLGYSVSVKEFQVVGRQPGAPLPPEPFEGYNVTFTVEHCKVLVFNTKAYETETPVETLTCKAKDEEGNIVAYDPEDIELQPQVSFKVVCDDGYSVTVNNITITPRENYKNLKQNPDNVAGQENIFRATKIQGDITIAIVAQAGEQAKGYKITFNTTNCSVKVYVGPKNADGTNLDTPEDGVYYARIKDSPYDIGYTTPQLNFEVVCETGFTFTATPDDNNKVDFIVGDYNKFSDKGGYYNLTKIASDLTITIVAVAA